MHSHEQRHIADVIRQQRFRLEGVRAGLEEGPGDLVDKIMQRMFDVEHFLENDIRERPRRRRVRARLRRTFEPRLGRLKHHSPAPLRLPSSYWSVAPPNPAPKISIVTPSFGQGHFIERTLFSVTSQRYPNLEYVVQDGGSKDETVDILRHREAELTRWASAPDKGHGDALNRGFAHTDGEIMAYLNSDDLLLPGSLAYVARYFAEHPEVDVVYGHRVLIDDADRQLGIWVMPGHDDDAMRLIDYIPQETMFWRRRMWEAIGGSFDTSFKFAIDWDLLLRFHEQGARFERLPRYLGAFRVHDDQKTQRDQDACDEDCERLRLRTHGREVTLSEAVTRTEPFLRRHVRAHLWERVKARVPRSTTLVETIPSDAWGYGRDADLHEVGSASGTHAADRIVAAEVAAVPIADRHR